MAYIFPTPNLVRRKIKCIRLVFNLWIVRVNTVFLQLKHLDNDTNLVGEECILGALEKASDYKRSFER
jgi:hypothetical protein